MRNDKLLQHPVLQVKIAGKEIDERPARFSFDADIDFHNVCGRLEFPETSRVGNKGDDIVISLVQDDITSCVFTGHIYSVGNSDGFRYLGVSDSFDKLALTTITLSYRKETASTILQDILDAAGISDTSITCPAVTLARFSSKTTSAAMALKFLIAALAEHGEEGLMYFFDEKDVFHFGKITDTGKITGENIILETGKNIIKRKDDCIITLPLPVRPTQTITVDNKTMLVYRNWFAVSPRLSRSFIFAEEAS